MSDIRLPQRPLVELAPPVDGLDQVRGEAGKRRRRRAGVVGASLTTAAGIAVVVALSGGSGDLAMLKPAPPAGQLVVEPSPSSSSTPAPAVNAASRSPHRRHGHSSATVTTSHRAQRAGSAGGPDGAPPAMGPGPAPAKNVTPTVQRWQSSYTGAPRECTGSTYGDTGGTLQNSVGWCLDAVASPVTDGVQLHFQLCRDSTGGGTLTFAETREVELVVRQGNRTVWDSAALSGSGPAPHRLTAAANGCWNWSIVWPGTTQDGAAVGHGSFTFVGTSTADEVKGHPSQSAQFSY